MSIAETRPFPIGDLDPWNAIVSEGLLRHQEAARANTVAFSPPTPLRERRTGGTVIGASHAQLKWQGRNVGHVAISVIPPNGIITAYDMYRSRDGDRLTFQGIRGAAYLALATQVSYPNPEHILPGVGCLEIYEGAAPRIAASRRIGTLGTAETIEFGAYSSFRKEAPVAETVGLCDKTGNPSLDSDTGRRYGPEHHAFNNSDGIQACGFVALTTKISEEMCWDVMRSLGAHPYEEQ